MGRLVASTPARHWEPAALHPPAQQLGACSGGSAAAARAAPAAAPYVIAAPQGQSISWIHAAALRRCGGRNSCRCCAARRHGSMHVRGAAARRQASAAQPPYGVVVARRASSRVGVPDAILPLRQHRTRRPEPWIFAASHGAERLMYPPPLSGNRCPARLGLRCWVGATRNAFRSAGRGLRDFAFGPATWRPGCHPPW